MTRLVLVDATVLHSFSRIGRLELLELLLRGQGRWTEAVAYEVNHANESSGWATERWLGEPIQIDSAQDMAEVERLRRSVLGGSVAEPLRHLGAAQSLHLLQSDPTFTGATLLSDEAASVDFVRRQGLIVWETPDLLRDGVAIGDVTAEVATGALQAIQGQGPNHRR